MKLGRTILTSLALGLLAAPAAAQPNAPTMGRSIASLSQVPLKSRDGARITLGSRIQPGKPTLIAFWASWCMPCVIEAPYLNQLRKDLGDRFNFLYVNRREGDPDPDQPAAVNARFLARAGMSDVDYVVADVPAYGRIVAGDMKDIPEGLVGIPRVYLFDRKGRQIYTTYGFTEQLGQELERRLKQAVAQ